MGENEGKLSDAERRQPRNWTKEEMKEFMEFFTRLQIASGHEREEDDASARR